MKSISLKILSLLLLTGLLLNPALSFQGASDGLVLWFNVVFPTLFPFLAATSLVMAVHAVPLLMKPFLPILKPIMGLGEAGCYTFLTGLLCGYPVGAKHAADFVVSGQISKNEGAYLLSISTYPSLMFLIGYVLPHMSRDTRFFQVFLSLLLSALPISILSRRVYKIGQSGRTAFLKGGEGISASIDNILLSSLEIMEKICAYLMLFSILAAFWNFYVPGGFPLKAQILGLFEMTVGIRELSGGPDGLLKDTSIVAAAAFGGLSGAAQTWTVIKNAGLSIRHYIAWKWLHLSLSSLIFILLSSLPPLAR